MCIYVVNLVSLFTGEMDTDLYDEFGNYVGPELGSDDDDDDDSEEEVMEREEPGYGEDVSNHTI